MDGIKNINVSHINAVGDKIIDGLKMIVAISAKRSMGSETLRNRRLLKKKKTRICVDWLHN